MKTQNFIFWTVSYSFSFFIDDWSKSNEIGSLIFLCQLIRKPTNKIIKNHIRTCPNERVNGKKDKMSDKMLYDSKNVVQWKKNCIFQFHEISIWVHLLIEFVCVRADFFYNTCSLCIILVDGLWICKLGVIFFFLHPHFKCLYTHDYLIFFFVDALLVYGFIELHNFKLVWSEYYYINNCWNDVLMRKSCKWFWKGALP